MSIHHGNVTHRKSIAISFGSLLSNSYDYQFTRNRFKTSQIKLTGEDERLAE
jgi:hypothetical protein